jgi:hypothetical protein
MAEEEPKIHVDADWKAQAQQEKQRLAEQEKAKSEGEGEGEAQQGQGQMPPANFETLMSTMATQALFALGAIPDPRTGQASVSLELARHHIDMLSVLEEKTQGNLTNEESNTLTQTVAELRQRYVQVHDALQQQAQQPQGESGQGQSPGIAQPGQGGAAGGPGPIQTG